MQERVLAINIVVFLHTGRKEKVEGAANTTRLHALLVGTLL